MKDYKTEGIIIRVRDYNEADRIITLLTREHGKVQAIAKGCRKQKSRKRGIIQQFIYGDFILYRGRSLDTITQCEARESFAVLREDLDRMAYGSYVTELLDGFAIPGERQEELFYLTLISLHLLSLDDPVLVTRAFEIRLMNLLGYRPHLETCVNCGGKLTGARIAFSSRLGGCLCQFCVPGDPESSVCSMGTINMLRQLSTWDLKRLRILKMTPDIRKESGEMMKKYIAARLDKKIKSADFLQSLESMQNIG